jgi:glutamyl-tRNA synthetase
MRITHVIRGQDHLTNTHKQILIYEALGATPPIFGHLPLILAPNKGKLSKRKHGEVVSLTTYRDNGFVAAAFRNFLALMGWSAGEEKEIYTLEELIEKFSFDGVHRSNAVFNFKENDPRHWTDDKALWMNAEYIRTMPLADLLPLVKAELKAEKLWRDEYEDDDKAWFDNTIDLIRQRFFTLKDFSTQGRAYFSEDYDFDPAAFAKNLSKFPDLQSWLPELAVRFEPMEDFSHDRIEEVVKAFTEEKGTKLGVIMNGARTLLTGLAVGPSMLAVFETIGKEKSILRLRSGLAWNS